MNQKQKIILKELFVKFFDYYNYDIEKLIEKPKALLSTSDENKISIYNNEKKEYKNLQETYGIKADDYVFMRIYSGSCKIGFDYVKILNAYGIQGSNEDLINTSFINSKEKKKGILGVFGAKEDTLRLHIEAKPALIEINKFIYKILKSIGCEMDYEEEDINEGIVNGIVIEDGIGMFGTLESKVGGKEDFSVAYDSLIGGSEQKYVEKGQFSISFSFDFEKYEYFSSEYTLFVEKFSNAIKNTLSKLEIN